MKKELQKYFEGIGRRKTAVARVRITPGQTGFTVNDADMKSYFKTDSQRFTAGKPIEKIQLPDKASVSVKVQGGGLAAQADAVSLGLARAIVLLDETTKTALRGLGLLTRDPRMVERKKYGLKKARRAPQWAKR